MFTKEALIKMGMTEEQAIQFLADLEASYVLKTDFDQVKADLEAEQGKVADRDKQIADLSKFKGTAEDLEKEVERLTQENANKDAEKQKALESERLANRINLELLTDEEFVPHNPDMVVGLLNLEQLKLKEDNTVEGLAEQLKQIKEAHTYLFKKVEKNDTQQPANPFGFKFLGQTPPDGDKGSDTPDNSESFGKALAQSKLASLGINTNQN